MLQQYSHVTQYELISRTDNKQRHFHCLYKPNTRAFKVGYYFHLILNTKMGKLSTYLCSKVINMNNEIEKLTSEELLLNIPTDLSQ